MEGQEAAREDEIRMPASLLCWRAVDNVKCSGLLLYGVESFLVFGDAFPEGIQTFVDTLDVLP